MIQKLYISLFFFLFSLSLAGQPWFYTLDSIHQKSKKGVNFFDRQAAFSNYWQKRNIRNAKGWKQFKRWEHFMEARIPENGSFPKLQLWKEYQQNSKRNEAQSIGNWSFLGPDDTPMWLGYTQKFGSGRINCIAFHPENEKIMWAGSPSGGIWKTTDAGESWHTTTDHLPSIGVSDIAVHPENPDILYIATGDGDAYDTYTAGIMISEDGGKTWKTTGLSYDVVSRITIRRLFINPQEPDILLAATSSGIFRSDDAAKTWHKTASGHFIDIEAKPGSPEIIYASTYGYGAAIYKSDNGGKSFRKTSDSYISTFTERIELAVTEAKPDIVCAVSSSSFNSGFRGFYKSNDSGETWEQLSDKDTPNLLGINADGSDKGGQGWYDLSLAISPLNEDVIYVGGINIWRSADGGETWQIDAHYWGDGDASLVHADHHDLLYSPHTFELFSGNDGGVYYKSTSDGWTDISDGLQILQVYRIGTYSSDIPFVMSGTQDNGTMRLKNNVWNAVLGGDGMECIVDYENPQVIYSELYYGDIRKSTNGGETFTVIKPKEALDGDWITPFIMHPASHNALFAGYEAVYKTTDGGGSWQKISPDVTTLFSDYSLRITALCISPSMPSVMYAATPHNIFRTENQMTWKEIGKELPSQEITYLAVAPNNPDELYVTFSGFSETNKVYRTTDGGQTWTNFSEGLPNLPVNCIVCEKGEAKQLFVGTDLGVYYRDENSDTWIAFNNGLPNVIVNELEIIYGDDMNRLFAATFGRGLWQTPLPPKADFTAEETEICVGREIVFTDNSYYDVENHIWNFGDGAVPQTAEGQGPHRVKYEISGKKNISLTVTKNGKSNKELKREYIHVVPENNLFVFPNPNNGQFTIKYTSKSREKVILRIYNLTGAKVFSTETEKNSDILQLSVDAQHLNYGMYIIAVESDGKRAKQIVLIRKF